MNCHSIQGTEQTDDLDRLRATLSRTQATLATRDTAVTDLTKQVEDARKKAEQAEVRHRLYTTDTGKSRNHCLRLRSHLCNKATISSLTASTTQLRKRVAALEKRDGQLKRVQKDLATAKQRESDQTEEGQ